MLPPTRDAIVLYSSLSDDPDLGALVTLFVEEMPDRVAALERAFEAGNWDAVQRLAHQMKGAAGSYGFEQITPYAIRLEMAARRRDDHLELRSACDEFVGACQRIRSGTPPR
jgi:HPt (histidine-containing phosphotransfer) domain-containing protein